MGTGITGSQLFKPENSSPAASTRAALTAFGNNLFKVLFLIVRDNKYMVYCNIQHATTLKRISVHYE